MSAVLPEQPLMEQPAKPHAQRVSMDIMELLQAVLLAPSINIMQPGLVALPPLTASAAPRVQALMEQPVRLRAQCALMGIMELLPMDV